MSYHDRLKKGFRIFLDFETSGLKDKNNQIFTAGIVVKNDLTGKTVHEEQYQLRLKEGHLPSIEALRANKLEPWTDKYKSASISESEFVNKITNLSKQYSLSDGEKVIKPKLTAYNADFDKFFLNVAMSRNGKNFSDYFDKSVSDPLKTVRRLVKEGKIETPKNKRGNSSRLEDVVPALGISRKDRQAHAALSDAKDCASVYEKAMELATGESPYSSKSVNPELFANNEIVKIKTNSQSSGVKERHVMILNNLEEDGQILALDLDDIRKNKGFKDSAVRTFNYSTIIGEEMPNEADTDELKLYYREFKSEIDDVLKKKNERSSNNLDDEFGEIASDFELIDSIEEGVFLGEFKHSDIESMLINQGHDQRTVNSLITKAHQLSLSRGHKGVRPIPETKFLDNFDNIRDGFVNHAEKMDLESMKKEDWVVVSYFDYLESKSPDEFKSERFAKIKELQKHYLLMDMDVEGSQVEVIDRTNSGFGQYSRCTICGKKLKSKRSSFTGIGPECAGVAIKTN